MKQRFYNLNIPSVDLGANPNNQNNEGFCTTGSSVHFIVSFSLIKTFINLYLLG